jgi:ferric-dicitrate binding protein FerR (iron transport regulator)
MFDRPQKHEIRSISEEAGDWLVLLRAGDMSDQDKLAYVHWLKKSPAHIREILMLVNIEELVRQTQVKSPRAAKAPSDASKVLAFEMPAPK